MKPSLGRIVLFHGVNSNDAIEHPAVITRVWKDEDVNLAVFLDNGSLINRSNIIQDEKMKQEIGWRWPPVVK